MIFVGDGLRHVDSDSEHIITGIHGLKERLRYGKADLLFAFLARGANAPLAFAANIIIARVLGLVRYGIYATLLSAALVVSGLAVYGTGPVLTREIAAQPQQARPAMVAAISRWAFALIGRLSLAGIVLLGGWLTFGPGAPPSQGWERVATVSIIPLAAGLIVISSILAGFSQVAKSVVIGNVWKNGVLLCGATVLLFVNLHRITDVLWLQAASTAFALCLGIYWIRRAVQVPGICPTVPVIIPDLGGRENIHRTWRRSAGHFFSMSAAILIVGRLDVVIVNGVAGPTQAGLFGAATRLAQIAGIGGLAWLGWLEPRISRYVHLQHGMAAVDTLRAGLIGSVGMTTVIVAVSWIMAPTLVSLFGHGFEGAVTPFRWLLMGYLIWAPAVPYYVLLTMSGHESITARLIWAQAILTLTASFPLVYYFGALGGAWAWVAGMSLVTPLIIIMGLREGRHEA